MKKIFSILFVFTMLSVQQSIAQHNTTSQISKLYTSYFALKDALVKSNGTLASESAGLMLIAIDSINVAEFGSEQQSAWIKVEKNIKFNAKHIKENKDPEHQREHFIKLSNNLYEFIKVVKPAETVYYQFCPMANDGKGANWLSKEPVIKNPYYGSMMLSCGKTVEVIKQ